MNTLRINRESLERLQQKANEAAIRENKALGLTYKKIERGYIVEVSGNDVIKRVGKPKFGMIRVKKGKYSLKNG